MIKSHSASESKKSGILLHISSLPGKDAIGTLGKKAHEFIDLLSKTGQSTWQMLPIHPTYPDGSPFNSPSLFAGSPMLIDLKTLVDSADLKESAYQSYLKRVQNTSGTQVNHKFLWKHKLYGILQKAYQGFVTNSSRQRKKNFKNFLHHHRNWLDNYASFMALKQHFAWENSWNTWSDTKKALHTNKVKAAAQFHKYLQFVFDQQMHSLRRKAKKHEVELIGDTPFYPPYESADVWANPKLFQLSKESNMLWAAAVPPDYFSKKGQAWGFPIYKWGLVGSKNIHQQIYSWWKKRLKQELCFFDLVKLDHFRGFVAYGRVRPEERTGKNAHWIRGPGKKFFDYLEKQLSSLPLILEDLGVITNKVKDLRRKIGPGMKVFQFANFNRSPLTKSQNPNLPHNQKKDPHCVYYTGTHDNETLKQNISEKMDSKQRKNLINYLSQSQEKEINWKVIDIISASQAERVIFPMQDILYLGSKARMNNPSKSSGQWRWRLTGQQFEQFAKNLGPRLRKITRRHKRF